MILVVDSDNISYETLGIILKDIGAETKTWKITDTLEEEMVSDDILIDYINGRRNVCKSKVLLIDNNNVVQIFNKAMEKGEEYEEGGLKGEKR